MMNYNVSQYKLWEARRARERCQELVDKLPMSALDEAKETLEKLVEHYRELARLAANPPDLIVNVPQVNAVVDTIITTEE